MGLRVVISGAEKTTTTVSLKEPLACAHFILSALKCKLELVKLYAQNGAIARRSFPKTHLRPLLERISCMYVLR
jgi:hypothetical protein